MKRLVLIAAAVVLSTSSVFAGDSAASCAIPAKMAPAVAAPSPAAAPAELALQTTCPIMKGKAINTKLFVDHEGQRIYVCCGGCIGPVKKDPAAAIAELKKEGQKPCPVPVKK